MTTAQRRVIELETALADISAFCRFVISHSDMNRTQALADIAHDCNGINAEERCFQPRTAGYSRKEKQ